MLAARVRSGLWVAVALASASGIAAQPGPASRPASGRGAQDAAPLRVVVPEAIRRPRIDGHSDGPEWEGAARLRIDPAPKPADSRASSQAAPGGSAELRIQYDATSLYVSVKVEDPELVPGTRLNPGEGDGIALLLRRSDPKAAGASPSRGRERTLCVWFVPVGALVRHAVFERDGDAMAPSAAPWSGTLVQGSVRLGEGYAFEAALPFPAIFGNEGPTPLDFDWVRWDRGRAATPPGSRQWGGGSVDDPWEPHARLEFSGRPPLSELVVERTGTIDRLLEAMPHVLVPVGMLAIAALGLLVWGRTLQRWPRMRPFAHAAGVLFLVIALALPPFETWRRDRGFARRTTEIARLLSEELPRIEQGTLASFKGAQLDAPLLDLLSGRPVAPRQGYTFKSLFELAQDGFGTAVKRYPGLNCSVLPYWIDLASGQTERFHFEEPLRGHSLYAVFGRAQGLAQRRGRDETPPRLRVHFRAPGENADLEMRELSLEGPFDSGAVFNREDREMTFVRLPLKAAVAEVGFTPLEGEGLQLVGLTLASEPGDAGKPLALGSASEGGVATELRGPEPDEAGVELYPGQHVTVSIGAERQRRFERAWLFAAATSRADATPVPIDTKVGEVTFRFRGGKPALSVPLQYQTTLFHELTQRNVREPRSEPGSPETAFRWTGPRGEGRATYSLGIDLPQEALVEAVEFSCFGPHRVAFRSLVFGAERLVPPQEPSDSPLYVTSERREVALKPRIREVLGDAWFAIYRGGRLVHSTLPEAIGMNLASERRAAPALGDAKSFAPATRDIPGGRAYEVTVTWNGPGLAGALIGVFVPDVERESRQRAWMVVRILFCLLAAPALLAWAAHLLTSIGTLRVRLLSVLGVAMVVPLAVLSILLVGVLESEHERGQTEGLRRAAADVVARLDAVQAQMSASATSWVETLARLCAGQDAPSGDPTATFARLQPLLTAVLQSELPPAWRGGRMTLEIAAGTAHPSLITVPPDPFASERAAADGRTLPGMAMSEGRLWLSGRASAELKGLGKAVLVAERPFDDALLASLDPARTLVVSDAEGFPLAVAGGQAEEETPASELLRDVSAMRERRQLFTEVSDRSLTASRRHVFAGYGFAAAYRPLAEGASGPRAMIGVLEALRRATVATPFGRLPVRSTFAAIAGLVLLVGVFLALVVTSKISRPIEQLERDALALRKGDLEPRRVRGESGQIDRLQESFQLMAQELRMRTQDLGALSRCIQDLGASGSELEVHAQVLSFCARQSPADRVRSFATPANAAGALVVDGDPEAALVGSSPVMELALAAGAPFCILLDRVAPGDAAREVLVGYGHALVVPWPTTGRPLGAVVLLFTSKQAPEVVIEPIVAVVAHAATAITNLRLSATALEDLATGALRAEPFGRRVADAITTSVQTRVPCAVIALEAIEVDVTKDAAAKDAIARSAAALLRSELPKDAVFGRVGEFAFRVLVSGVDRVASQQLAARWATLLGSAVSAASQVGSRWFGVAVVAPEDASSAEFLRDVLERRLREPVANASEAAPLAVTQDRRNDLAAVGLVVGTPAMQNLIATVEKVAPTELTLLIEGETGTGKEGLANLVHSWSRRSAGPLVRVHCAAIPANLLQSELFGHEKGAFTGALTRKAGKFEQASGGTIFLDEIGEISQEVQVSLLRVLQERVVDRIGGTEPVSVDVRVLTATNRNLREMVAQGTFREDLYYRLSGMVMTVPPLRERKAEIPALAERFLREAIAAEQTKARAFAPEALDALFGRDWPGNIRELRNVVLRAAVLANGPWIRPADLGAVGDAPPRPSEVEIPAVPALGPEVVPEPSGAPVEEVLSPTPAAREVGSRLDRLLQLAETRGSLAVQDVVDELGVSSRTGLRDLNALIEAGKLVRVGSRRGARYRLPR